ncbi:hypothetical protein ABK040_010174 [Willaertia magna]
MLKSTYSRSSTTTKKLSACLLAKNIQKKQCFSTMLTKNNSTAYGGIVLPDVKNEPLRSYPKGSADRENLLAECEKYLNIPEDKVLNIPCIVNGERIYHNPSTDKDLIFDREIPSLRKQKLYRLHSATSEIINEAIEGSLKAQKLWEELPMEQKCSIFLKAAELIASPENWRHKLNAATMIGQGKTIWQAEIDSAAETIDFLRFNAMYAGRLLNRQVEHHSPGIWNRLEYRPLEGFVAAISPFNFTAIGANLPCAPVQMGNVALWKPSELSALSNYLLYLILEEAGLPSGVIQFLPCKDAPVFGNTVLKNENFAGLHFTGSTKVFQLLYQQIASNLQNYRQYPRIVGETGGKNFSLLHPDYCNSERDFDNYITQTIRGAFEYSGQKCSATSRCYVPKSKWSQVRERLVEEVRKLKIGQPNDTTSFSSCVIDEKAFDRIAGYIDRAKQNPKCEIVVGGGYSKEIGYFVEPTIIHTQDPKSETMVQEIFGPVLSVYVYDDSSQTYLDEILRLIDGSCGYGLTGSIFARDRYVIDKCLNTLRHSAGNFYINDKSTGAVVGQQPFGGGRTSGTNDKAGSEFMLQRWVSLRAIKENFLPASHWGYPSIDN